MSKLMQLYKAQLVWNVKQYQGEIDRLRQEVEIFGPTFDDPQYYAEVEEDIKTLKARLVVAMHDLE